MLNVKLQGVSLNDKELSQEEFLKQLKDFVGTWTCIDFINCGFSILHQYDNFDFYTYQKEKTFEDILMLGDADEENLDFAICLDCVELIQYDPISRVFLLTFDKGLQIHIWTEEIV